MAATDRGAIGGPIGVRSGSNRMMMIEPITAGPISMVASLMPSGSTATARPSMNLMPTFCGSSCPASGSSTPPRRESCAIARTWFSRSAEEISRSPSICISSIGPRGRSAASAWRWWPLLRRGLSSVGRNPTLVQTPSIPNPPRYPYRSFNSIPTRRAAARMPSRIAVGGFQKFAACAYTNSGRSTRRRMIISTGRNTATPSLVTKPWIEHGMPSRNGITRTSAAWSLNHSTAGATSPTSRTHRAYSPPPCHPSVLSATHTVPRSEASSAAAVGASATGTTADGALRTPASSHS